VPVTVEMRAVRFGYGGDAVLEDVDLSFSSGDFVVLAGPNGSGKSTLLRLCAGLLTPQAGQVRVLGGSPGDPAVRRRIGYVPQGLRAPGIVPVSVREVVGAGLTPARGLFHRLRRSDWDRVASALDAVGIVDLSSECLFELSGGQQQRAMLARALVGDPELILLDEPTTGIDQRFRPVVAEELRARAERGATVVVVTHDPEDFHLVVTRIVLLGEGAPRELAHDEFHAAMGAPTT
jgi:ABC-type Mn2+/Zn2+ transport system ATPase subunit